jgi:dihydroxyacetone kinase-like protein
MNFEMAAEMCDARNAMVLVNDDVAVENSSHTTGTARRRRDGHRRKGRRQPRRSRRRSCAVQGVRRSGRRAHGVDGRRVYELHRACRGTTTFRLGDDEMEVGVGIHGEPGRRRTKLGSADAISSELLESIVADLEPEKGAELLLLVNGLGGTPARRALPSVQLGASVARTQRACASRDR